MRLLAYLQAAGALAPVTPLQSSSFLIQPALTTTSRLSRVTGTGVSRRDCSETFFGPEFQVPALSTGLPCDSAMAAAAASRPSSRESLKMVAVWVHSANRLSAAKSAT